MLQTNAEIFRHPDGRKLGYSQYGDPKGKSLFYFHGWPGSRLSGKKYDSLAKKLHIRLIAPDRPGYGLSDFKKDRTLLDWPSDVVALANYLKIRKFAVMGVSGGGPYAAVCAYKIPERLTKTGIVVGLAPTYVPGLLDGIMWTGRIGWANYKYPFMRTAAAIIQFLNARVGPALRVHRFFFGAKADRKMYANPHIRRAMQRTFREAFRQGYRGPEFDLKLYTDDWGFDLRKIRTKTYLWYGEKDQNVSLAMGKYYASQIPGSKLTVYPNEGHLISVSHAEEILQTLSDTSKGRVFSYIDPTKSIAQKNWDALL